MASLVVLGLAMQTHATTYNWTGNSSTSSGYYRYASLWYDSTHTAPASDSVLDTLLNDASQGASFVVADPNKNIALAASGIDGGNWIINAPFTYNSADANNNSSGFQVNAQAANRVYTFNNMSFRGTMNFQDVGSGPLTLAGSIVVPSSPFTIIARGVNPNTTSNPNGDAPVANITAAIDASRVDAYTVKWRTGTSNTSPGNQSSIHLRNSNNAFFGTWTISTRIYADLDGSLGDADVVVRGAGGTTLHADANDPNIMIADDYNLGKDQGILWLKSNNAISPTASLELQPQTTASNYTPDGHGKVVIDSGVNVNVRQFIVDGVKISAGTYNASSTGMSGRIEGSGSITVADVNATAVMTMECRDTSGTVISGDVGLMPRVGTKGYKPNYAARIRAKSTLAISGVGYTFTKWQVGGVDYSTSADTTVTMDASKTVTAVYTRNLGASSPTPANTASGVSTITGISWTPDPAATSQSVYFGQSTSVYGTAATPVYTGNGSLSSLDITQLGGALKDATNYYWQVRSNVSGDTKPQWMFTTCNAKAATPSPANAAMGQASSLTLSWACADTGVTSYNVYFSTDKTAVLNGTVTPTNVATASLAQSSLPRGVWHYWRVDAKLGTARTVVGDVWSFRTTGYAVTMNTDSGVITDETGTPTYTAVVDDADVRIFKFTTFPYGPTYDITVTGSKRLAIWSDNDISFGAVLNASAPTNSAGGVNGEGLAVAGGYKGGNSVFVVNKSGTTDPNYTLSYRWYPPGTNTTQNYWIYGDMNYWRRREGANTTIGYPKNNDTLYGPGRPYAQGNYQTLASPKIRVDTLYGAGGTYGGFGGGSYNMGNPILPNHAGAYASYPALNLPGTYGQRELYELWGGSGGSGGGRGGLNSTTVVPSCRARGGAGGGGVVELYSINGSVSIGSYAQILANGGSTLLDNGRYANDAPETPIVIGGSTGNPATGGGAGSGGSIRVVAKNNVTVAGTLSAAGGQGADAPACAASTACIGAGGGGGRIAIYKGASVSSTGTINVAGGRGGRYNGMTSAQITAVDAKPGTVYGLSAGEGNIANIRVAHDPIPTDGTGVTDANNVTLYWRPALGTTTMNLYFGTTSTPPLAQAYPAMGTYYRAQKSFLTGASAPVGTTYYWRVECDGVMGPLWTYKVLSYEARNPVPASGATQIDPNKPTLSWTAGFAAPTTSWDVFFGTDKNAVASATTATTGIFLGSTTTPTMVAPLLRASTTYYWRVDEHNSKSTNAYTGLVWNFTTNVPACSAMIYADLSGDCRVTFLDFALMASNWKKCNLYIGCP